MPTFTAMYERREDAERVQAELSRLGIIDTDGVGIHDQQSTGLSSDNQGSEHGSGFFGSLRDMFVPDEDSQTYGEGIRRGHYLLTVNTDEQNVDRVHDILENSTAVDVDEKASAWRNEGWSGGTAQAAMGTAGARTQATGRQVGEEHIPIVEEQLAVGKREVSRGGVRVRSYVKETPVEEQVRLREEHVDIERRPVDQPLSAANLQGDAFQEREIEVTETAEEAVIGKNARVVEEVVVKKDVGERTETVHDTVRRTEVEIDRLGDRNEDRSAMFDRDKSQTDKPTGGRF